MDRRERSASLDTAVLAALQGFQTELWTALPGVVASGLDPARRTVTVQPSVQARAQNKDGSFEWVTLPVLPDVPVYFPEGGGVTLTFPVRAGDECLVVFASRCIDAWWQSGGVQSQADLRLHDLSDGFALVGVSSVPRVIPDISTSRAQLRSNDHEAFVEIDPSTHLVRVKTSGDLQAEVGGDVDVEADGGIRVRAQGVLDLESAVLINLRAPAVNLTAFPGSVTSISGGTFNVANTTWNYSNNNIAYAGGTMTYNGKNITNTHTHTNVQTGPNNSGQVT